jgi:Ca2+/Na+ antiporter
MASRKFRDAPQGKESLFVFVFLFVLIEFVLVFRKIAILIKLVIIFVVGVFFVFLVFFFDVIGDRVQRHRMRLRNFQFALALRAAQNLALFHFVFVHINFCGTFRTAEHVSILRFDY